MECLLWSWLTKYNESLDKKIKTDNEQENGTVKKTTKTNKKNVKKKKKNRQKTTKIIYHVLILREHIVSRVSSHFPIGGHSVIRTSIKI